MTQDLRQKLNARWPSFTTSEQKIAAYLQRNLTAIPFETAASLAKHVGVSAVTVGRFLRKLGYAGVVEMKEELRGDREWLKLYRNPVPSTNVDADADDLRAEIRALSDARALVRAPEWRPIVKLLASAEHVSIASFQLGSFLGISFATLLQHVRPHVAFATGLDGAYGNVLVDLTGKDCVVLIDKRRYSKHFRILCEEVVARGIPLVILTDTQCYWARQLTPHVLMIPVNDDRAWHSFGAFSSLFSMLVGAVIEAGGDAVYGRIEQITSFRQRFVGFSASTSASRRVQKHAQQAGEAAPISGHRGRGRRGKSA